MGVTLEGQRKESVWVSMRRQRARRALVKKIMIRPKKNLEASRRPCRAIHKRVKTLKELVPNTKSSEGLDGLFRQTADYILALEMKVRVMQTMVQVLTETDSAKEIQERTMTDLIAKSRIGPVLELQVESA
ncbi:hypothetical protein YC2023_063640 [Brassica napus]